MAASAASIAALPRGESHPHWKGEEATYASKHAWVSANKTKAGCCSSCGQERYTEWANVSGRYLRDLGDYIELCKPCHTIRDGNGNAKLTPEVVLEIRAAKLVERAYGFNQRWAKKLGVSPTTISEVVRGIKWRYLLKEHEVYNER